MAIRHYIADSSAFPAIDLPSRSKGVVRSCLARPERMGLSGQLMRTTGDHSLSSIAIH